MTHDPLDDPMLDGITTWQASMHYLYPVNDDTPMHSGRMKAVLFSDLPALIARVREDERQKAHNVIYRFDMFSGDRDAMHAWINGTPPDWWTGERS